MKRRRVLSVALVIAIASTASLVSAQPVLREMPDKRVVSESEMGRYLKSIEKLVALGAEAQLEADPGQRWVYSDPMVRAITDNGFDEVSFTQVHWNVMMGYMALEMEAHQPDIDRARQKQAVEMEKMREHMSPEQFEQMKKSLSGVLEMANLYSDVPPENIALVKRHKAELDKLWKNRAKP